MSRKVFLSVLGSSDYRSCKYYDLDANFISSETRFIQTALFEKEVSHWGSNDSVYLFLTEGETGSYMRNWKDNGHRNRENGEIIIAAGLETELKKIKTKALINLIPIKNGDNEKEIWENFHTIFEKFEDEDEVYFDVTHGFRLLPMLVLVLLNYSKFLKRIKIKAITYGNFEARDSENKAPIINLSTLSELQDWSVAASNFTEFGNAKKLSELVTADIQPIMEFSKGTDIYAANLRGIMCNLNQLIDNILTTRGKSIIKNKEGVRINEYLKIIENHLVDIHPFTPILHKIRQEVQPFENSNTILNGLNAVKWCSQNNLIPQGITLIQELQITIICQIIEIDVDNVDLRNLASKLIFKVTHKCDLSELPNEYPENKAIVIKAIESINSWFEFAKAFNQFGEVRNDINHAGFRKNAIDKPMRFKERLEQGIIQLELLMKQKGFI